MADIILDRFLVNSNNANKKINDFIENKDEYLTNSYKILSTIPNNYKLQYFFIVICIYAFFKNGNIRLNEIFVFLVSVLLIYILSQKNYSDFLKFTNTKNNELKFLNKIMYNGVDTIKGDIIDYEISNEQQKKSYLYYSPLIISLMYNLRKYVQYNIKSYSSCLYNINIFLKICFQANDLEYNLVENYESLIIRKKKILNELSTLIYSIETSTVTYNKLNDSIILLHKLLNRHIDIISKLFKDKTSNNINNINYIPPDVFEKHNHTFSNDIQINNFQSSYNIY